MPSAFTHALVGAALVRVVPPTLRRWPLVLGLAVVAVLPDLDFIGHQRGVPYGAVFGHRGWSHSLSAALLVGGCAWLWH